MPRSLVRLAPYLIGVVTFGALARDASAVPAAGQPFTLRQPDGRPVAARLTGDEWDHAIETLEGHTVVQDRVSGAWVYATVDTAGALVSSGIVAGHAAPADLPPHVRSATAALVRRDAVATEGAPVRTALGVHRMLVVVADFTPSISHGVTEEEFARQFFGDGVTDAPSVADYWRTVSYGRLTIVPAPESYGRADDGVVFVTLPTPLPAPPECDTTMLGGCLAPVARRALTAADEFVDFASLDANSDGYLDVTEAHVMVVLRGIEAAGGGHGCGPISVWAHRAAFGDDGDFAAPTLDGVRVGHRRGAPDAGTKRGGYMMQGEWHDDCAGSGHPATIGVAAHELGHDLGAPDLYPSGLTSTGLGYWSVMASGSWTRREGDARGSLPAWPDAYTRALIGIDEPVALERSIRTLALPPVELAGGPGRVLRAPVHPTEHWSLDACGTGSVAANGSGEYFLLENRQQSGYDAGLPGSGLLIWHVFEGPFEREDGARCTPNVPDVHGRRLVALIQADGQNDLERECAAEGQRCNAGDASDPWPASPPKRFDAGSIPSSRLYSGDPSGLVVENIVAADGVVIADVLLPICGNGIREDGEACDDGDVDTGDGCGPTCVVEPCWTCDDGEPSSCAPLPDGSACDDGDACTAPDACRSGACASPARECDDHVACTTDACVPTIGCSNVPDHAACAACEACSATDGCRVGPRPVVPPTASDGCWISRRRTSKLQMRSGHGTRGDRLHWRWGAGTAAVPASALGDPTRTTTYDVCMFGPDGDLVFRATAAASCDGRACWTRRPRGAFRYRDPSGTQHGLTDLRAIPGRRPSFAFTAHGAALDLPPLPLHLPVVVELQADHARCWSGRFWDRRGQHNDAVRFRGSGN